MKGAKREISPAPVFVFCARGILRDQLRKEGKYVVIGRLASGCGKVCLICRGCFDVKRYMFLSQEGIWVEVVDVGLK